MEKSRNEGSFSKGGEFIEDDAGTDAGTDPGTDAGTDTGTDTEADTGGGTGGGGLSGHPVDAAALDRLQNTAEAVEEDAEEAAAEAAMPFSERVDELSENEQQEFYKFICSGLASTTGNALCRKLKVSELNEKEASHVGYAFYRLLTAYDLATVKTAKGQAWLALGEACYMVFAPRLGELKAAKALPEKQTDAKEEASGFPTI